MDNTMRITIPWRPGMAVMLKDGRSVPDESVVDYLAENGVNLERIEDGYASCQGVREMLSVPQLPQLGLPA